MKKFLRYSWLIVLPMVAAAAIVWKASAAEPQQQCPQVDPLDHTVLLPNPADCSTFFSCSMGIPILMFCPVGLLFNKMLEVCDWPVNSGCLKGSVVDVKETQEIFKTTEPGWSFEIGANGGAGKWHFNGVATMESPASFTRTTRNIEYKCCVFGATGSECNYVSCPIGMI